MYQKDKKKRNGQNRGGGRTRGGKKNNKQRSEYNDSFLKKVNFCKKHFNFNEPTQHEQEKKQRLQNLADISEMLSDQNAVYNVIMKNIQEFFDMITQNIFRPLPVITKSTVPGELGMEEEDQILDPAWPHLQPVYELFYQLILNDICDVKSLKVFITHGFVQEFLQLFDSEEPREREYLKNILHRLYAKLVPRRKMIRRAMNDNFHTLIHQRFKFNGVPELLDIYASIISGFAVPLREEHVLFFKNVIIPLHKVQTCQFYHEQLLRCSMLFLSKDPSLAIFLVKGLLRYWPFGNSTKETMFLSQLSEVLEVCDIQKLQPVVRSLFTRLIQCIAGSHLQVADRAMCFFENDYFLSILKAYKQVTFPMLVPVIAKIADTHWHKVLQESLNALKTILKEIDYSAFEKAIANQGSKTNNPLQLIHNPTDEKQRRRKEEKAWQQVLKTAQTNDQKFECPTEPYQAGHIVGKNNGLNNGNIYVLL